ncbi:MAG TPA: HypC/HybG/HupF family hydrogenase formation chaperone [Bacillota bacterium]|nr:HypC/HybG/HupF family hydrogenase formation chaperone [Bacillota bacterium]
MCLGIPGRVIELNPAENWAVVESFGVEKRVSTALVGDEITPGDYLMVHAGYAIGKVNLEEAEKTLKLWEEILLAE